MLVTTEITLELAYEQVSEVVYAKQGDKETRRVIVSLTERGKPYVISEGVSAYVYVRKPDKKHCYHQCQIEDGKIVIELTNQMLAVSGTASSEVQLRGSDGKILTTATFVLHIAKAVFNENAVLSANEVTALERLSKAAEEVVQRAEKAAEDAEQLYEDAQNGVFDGKDFTYEDFTPEQIDALKGKSAYALYVEAGGTLSLGGWLASLNAEKLDIVRSVDEMVDVEKRYILNDGGIGRIYAYQATATKKNQFDPNTAVYNARISSSGAIKSATGCVVTDFIPLTWGTLPYLFEITGITLADYAAQSYAVLCAYYDADKSLLGYATRGTDAFTDGQTLALNNLHNLYSSSYNPEAAENAAFVRFTLGINTGDASVSKADVEDLYIDFLQMTETPGFKDSGITLAMSDQGEEILVLEEKTADHETRLNLLEAGGQEGGVPLYWLSHLEEKAKKLRLAMEKAGRNRSAFLWYTDAHWANSNSKMSPVLLRYLYEHTPISKINFGGDIIGDSLLETRDKMEYLYEWRKAVRNLPSHHSVLGNHDHFISDSVDYEDDHFRYSFLIAPEESGDMVMSEAFTYYIDNRCEKTRYLYLDSGKNHISDEETAFVIDALNTTPDGWHIVAIGHIWFQYTAASTPTVGEMNPYMQKVLDLFDAYNARQNGSLTMVSQSAPYQFADCGGKVEFCMGGHTHYQHTFHSAAGIPVILTPPDANQVRGGDTYENGTPMEASVCGVVADYAASKISLIFVGRGTDAEVTMS